MRRRKILRVIGVAFLVGLLFSLATITITLLTVPRARTFLEPFIQLIGNSIPNVNREPANTGDTRTTWSDFNITQRSAKETPEPLPTVTTIQPPIVPTRWVPSRQLNPDSIVWRFLKERFLERGDRDFRICDNLDNRPDAPPKTFADYNLAMERFAMRIEPENVFVESSLITVGFFIAVPSVAEILTRIEDARRTGILTFTTDSRFDALLSLAKADLLANVEAFNRLAQHSYHLHVLSRAASINPDLQNSDELDQLCNRIEQLVEQGLNTDRSLDMTSEKAAVLRFLSISEISPESVGFDADLENEIEASFKSTHIEFDVPWINRVYEASFMIPIPR